MAMGAAAVHQASHSWVRRCPKSMVCWQCRTQAGCGVPERYRGAKELQALTNSLFLRAALLNVLQLEDFLLRWQGNNVTV